MSVRPLALASDAPARRPDARIRDVLAELSAGAGCLFDPELHDGPADGFEDVEERAAREAVAVDVCGDCPLLAVCRRYVARVQPPSGVWAELTPAERTAHAGPVVLGEVA